MKVFVLMSDGGYDGDTLLGVYATEIEAREAGSAWAASEGIPADETYVESVDLNASAEQRQTAIERSREQERRRRLVERKPGQELTCMDADSKDRWVSQVLDAWESGDEARMRTLCARYEVSRSEDGGMTILAEPHRGILAERVDFTVVKAA